MFNFKRDSMVGIDIHCSGVSMLEISSSNGQFRIDGIHRETFPLGVMAGGGIKNRRAVSDCIQRALARDCIHTKLAVVAVPDAAVITKIISVSAALNEREIEEFIRLQSDKYIPYPIHEVSIDFQILGYSIINSAMIDVFVAASRIENVTERVSAVSQAGLEVAIVDIESHAIERVAHRLFRVLPGDARDKVIALIDIGVLLTHLYVLQEKKVIFVREESFGCQSLSNELIGLDEYTPLPLDFDSVFLQIKRMLQFFFSSGPVHSVDYIILAGSIPNLGMLVLLIQEKTGIPTYLADPINSFYVNHTLDDGVLAELSPSMVMACGLGLRRLK